MITTYEYHQFFAVALPAEAPVAQPMVVRARSMGPLEGEASLAARTLQQVRSRYGALAVVAISQPESAE